MDKFQQLNEQLAINKLHRRFGFTLLELVIAMAIIAVITTAIWGNFFSSILKGRDARRKEDLESIARALELYYYDNKAYPIQPITSWGKSLVNPKNSSVVYLQRIPQDPSYPNANYCYITDASGSFYRLYANLENRSDPKILPTPSFCSGVMFNYGISSSNTTP